MSLKFLGQSSLLQNSIGSVSGFDFAVDDKMDVVDRTVPDLVITSPLPFKMAAHFH